MTAQKTIIADETLEALLQRIPGKETHHIPEGRFTGAIQNTIDPYFVVDSMNQELYEAFNNNPNKVIKSMYLETDEPIAISSQLMNGAREKLTNPESPEFLPHKKAQYAINHAHTDNPTLAIYPANGTYNTALFNQKDWEDF